MAKTRDVDITVKPHHLFIYPSEWDPRQAGRIKGGYLEGKIQLPHNYNGDLKVVLSTYPDTYLDFDSAMLSEEPGLLDIHPTLLHVVRKGKGNRRYNEKEPVPSIQHWCQEFRVMGRTVIMINKTSHMDTARYDKIEPIPMEEELLTLDDNMELIIGKDAGELNLILLIQNSY